MVLGPHRAQITEYTHVLYRLRVNPYTVLGPHRAQIAEYTHVLHRLRVNNKSKKQKF
jgi:hypothetical protein